MMQLPPGWLWSSEALTLPLPQVVDHWWQTESGSPMCGVQLEDVGTTLGSCALPVRSSRRAHSQTHAADLTGISLYATPARSEHEVETQRQPQRGTSCLGTTCRFSAQSTGRSCRMGRWAPSPSSYR
jgi:hypothetical protein